MQAQRYHGLVRIDDVEAPTRARRLVRKQVHPGWLAAQAAKLGMADMWRPEEQKARSLSLQMAPPAADITPLSVATAALQML